MKKLLLATLMLMLLAMPALAEETTNSDYNYDMMNQVGVLDHNHGYSNEEHDPAAGLGYDLTLHEDKGVLGQSGIMESSEIQSKWDMSNDEVSVFLVGQGNLPKMIDTVISWFKR